MRFRISVAAVMAVSLVVAGALPASASKAASPAATKLAMPSASVVKAMAPKKSSITFEVICVVGGLANGGLPPKMAMKLTYENSVLKPISSETTLLMKDAKGKSSKRYIDKTVNAQSQKTIEIPLKASTRKLALVAAMAGEEIAEMGWVDPRLLCGLHQGSLAPPRGKLVATSVTSVTVTYGSKTVVRTETLSVKNAGRKTVTLQLRGAVFWKKGKKYLDAPLPRQIKKLKPGQKWKLTPLASNGFIFGARRAGQDYSYGVYVLNSTYGATFKAPERSSAFTPWYKVVKAAKR